MVLTSMKVLRDRGRVAKCGNTPHAWIGSPGVGVDAFATCRVYLHLASTVF